MNDKKGKAAKNSYTSLLILNEVSKNGEMTQRDLSKRLGIALGLINSYIKNLAAKGYITISTIPRNRYKYFLTPKGFIEKTRLTYHHLQNFTNLYKVARRDFQALFYELEKKGIKNVTFCGVDEVAEIAYLSLREVNIKLVGVVDDEKAGERFFEYTVLPLNKLDGSAEEAIIVTKFHDEEVYKRLLDMGISNESIYRRGGGK